ncbi:NADH dehydrogenase [ubiquinone] 1 alpha subcomplex subunit 6-like [Achroia grisella]|uniref:NADH dehydrogenase [ubiquinone] 1 alpha subcomplex subunit 6-like n=1 Tax=Achroia grisella TaxID=688607 RepID=UPI0027D332DF|nr:NADH dehydrogenase [ubiquinone] 1 alpha subcomplex subunit 6-like [Achroia grisella]
MVAQGTIKTAYKNVRPLMSRDFCEARRKVLGLYRAFYRYIPYIVKYYDIPKSEEDCRWKIREYFYKNAWVADVRVTDLLVIKGYMELKEITHLWQQKGHVIAHWKPTAEPKPYDFLGKFFAGTD